MVNDIRDKGDSMLKMLIAFLENNLNEDGSVNIPEVLRPYMGGTEKICPKTK